MSLCDFCAEKKATHSVRDPKTGIQIPVCRNCAEGFRWANPGATVKRKGS